VHDIGLEHPTLAEIYAQLTVDPPSGGDRRTEPQARPDPVGSGAVERI